LTWVDWDGGDKNQPKGLVDLRLRDGEEQLNVDASGYRWKHVPSSSGWVGRDIVKYRMNNETRQSS
jgi:hypothetical protein